ncbi:MAG: hypothetical protein WDN44_15990 [Sphingomonas sp.]
MVRELAGVGGTGLVLGVGDSGSPLGNDRELLSGPHSVSVDSVCGSHLGGLDLVRVEAPRPGRAVADVAGRRVEDDGMRIDVSGLDLDG